MSDLKPPSVIIRYHTDYGSQPSNVTILATDSLLPVHLPELSDDSYNFLGWVHINEAGHESSLSERMIVSTEWLIPTGVKNEYYVIFTAKWKKGKTTGSGDFYTGSYTVTPKVTQQILPTANKLMQDDVTVKSIPIYSASNPSGGNTVYIAKEVS